MALSRYLSKLGSLLNSDGKVPAAGLAAGANALTLSTVSTTSGSAADFVDIPSWAKKITMVTDGMSTATDTEVYFRLGTASGFATTGYESVSWYFTAATPALSYSTGAFVFGGWQYNGNIYNSIITFTNAGGNVWLAQGTCYNSAYTSYSIAFNGRISLAAPLTKLRVQPASGAFDAGSVSIFYE